MSVPSDYVERVYAGVLGKLIGVYLGRPFEGWSYEQITASLGEVWYYVNGRRDLPLRNHTLVVTDDDVSGTFTFLRAMPDYGNPRDLTPAQVGQTWLNYIIEGRTILWWGGMGNSTEHTAYLRLAQGVPAPASGSIARNGQVVAEQIGAQIFIDGWGMIAPGDPELAADLARRAASVSHDGAAIHGAQVLAAMVAQAFAEPDLGRLLDVGLAQIPADSIIARLIGDLREWHLRDGDWRATRERVVARYGYDRYGGNCHIVPNHALVILALLYGGDDFQRAQMIANTAGWDTDCNAGNVGCLLGVKNGLAGIDAGPDWRGPVADRLYLATADGGRAISDAVAEAYQIVNIGRALRGLPALAPKAGARFHFTPPGSLQGFASAGPAALTIANVPGRGLELAASHLAPQIPALAATPTFIPPEAIEMPGYALLASPTLYPGQTVRARLAADPANPGPVSCQIVIAAYGAGDALRQAAGPAQPLGPGEAATLSWRVPELGGDPVASVGVMIASDQPTSARVYLDWMTWDGPPEVTLGRPDHSGTLWRRAWVDAVDQWDPQWPEAFRLAQNRGVGLISQGCREWADYQVSADITPHMAAACGLAARVQGLRRYYGLLLAAGGTIRLVKELDGTRTLAEAALAWEPGATYELRLRVVGAHIQAWVDGQLLLEIHDADRPLEGGAVGLLVAEGRTATERVRVGPA